MEYDWLNSKGSKGRGGGRARGIMRGKEGRTHGWSAEVYMRRRAGIGLDQRMIGRRSEKRHVETNSGPGLSRPVLRRQEDDLSQ